MSEEEEYTFDLRWLLEDGNAYLKNYPDESIYLEMPLVRLANRMIDMAAEGLPLTKTLNPKLSVLSELYPLGPKDWYIELYPEKKITMTSCNTLAIIWEILRVVGLFRKYKNELRLSRAGKKVKGHPHLLALHLLNALQFEADTSLVDGYEFTPFNASADKVAEMLYEFGDEYHPASFYAEKYANVDDEFGFLYSCVTVPGRDSLSSCFECRIMNRYFEWFGFVEKTKEHFDAEKGVFIRSEYKTTPLFKKFIGVGKETQKVTYPLFYPDNNLPS